MNASLHWLAAVGMLFGIQQARATEPMIEVQPDAEGWIVSSPDEPGVRYQVLPVLLQDDPIPLPPVEPEPHERWGFAGNGSLGGTFNMPQIVGFLIETVAGAEKCVVKDDLDPGDCWLFGGVLQASPGLAASKAGVGITALHYQNLVDKGGNRSRVLLEKHALRAGAWVGYLPPNRPATYHVGGEFESTWGLVGKRDLDPDLKHGRASWVLGLMLRLVDGQPDFKSSPWESMILSTGISINY